MNIIFNVHIFNIIIIVLQKHGNLSVITVNKQICVYTDRIKSYFKDDIYVNVLTNSLFPKHYSALCTTIVVYKFGFLHRIRKRFWIDQNLTQGQAVVAGNVALGSIDQKIERPAVERERQGKRLKVAAALTPPKSERPIDVSPRKYVPFCRSRERNLRRRGGRRVTGCRQTIRRTHVTIIIILIIIVLE